MFWHVYPPVRQTAPSVLFVHRTSLQAPQSWVLFITAGLPAGSCACAICARQRGDDGAWAGATSATGAAGAVDTATVVAPAGDPASTTQTSARRWNVLMRDSPCLRK